MAQTLVDLVLSNARTIVADRRLRLLGAEAGRALESLVPVDVLGLGVDKQRYAMFTNTNGGILDDLMVTHAADHGYLVVNGANGLAEISLDGMPEFHDKFRVARNSFKKAMETYDALEARDARRHADADEAPDSAGELWRGAGAGAATGAGAGAGAAATAVHR